MAYVQQQRHHHQTINIQPHSTRALHLAALQDPYRSQLEALLSAHVLPAFSSPWGHLRAKAAWLAKEFADISFSEGGSGAGPLFNTLLQQVINCLHDKWVARDCNRLRAAMCSSHSVRYNCIKKSLSVVAMS
jgi:hypothetical protein